MKAISRTVLTMLVSLHLGCMACSGAIVFETLHHFNGTNGALPEATLFQASDGWLYGTTTGGGTNQGTGWEGTIFRISTNGVFESLLSLGRVTGSGPQTGLIEGSDRRLYGVTASGGTGLVYGTFYNLELSGNFAVLYDFTWREGGNLHGVTLGPDGSFYGAAYSGGWPELGTVFKITKEGVPELLGSFSGPDGRRPQAPLLSANDGNLYGTTTGGGQYSHGTIYRVSPSGGLTRVISFDGTNGAAPLCTLFQGEDGSIYGAAAHGGIGFSGPYTGNGTVFKFTTNGSLTLIHQFRGYPDDGSNPGFGAITEFPDGYFYGTTQAGGNNASGTIYRMTRDGETALLYSFSRPDYQTSTNMDGHGPVAGVTQTRDGWFYGVAMSGGIYGKGTIFRFSVIEDSPAIRLIQQSSGSLQLQWKASRGKSYEIQHTPSLLSVDWALTKTLVATNTSVNEPLPLPENGRAFYRVRALP